MTSKHPVLVLARLPADLRSALSQRFELVEFDGNTTGTWTGFTLAITTGVQGAGAREFAACPDLRLLVSQGVGLDRIDLGEARRRRIVVGHTPDELSEDVGDAAIAMTYALLRGVVHADRFVRAGRWPTERIGATRRVSGRTMGIVGLGRIGSHVARRAEAIGMNVLYHARRERVPSPYPFVADLPELAARADVLVLACPGGDSTRHLVDCTVLHRLGPDGFVVNVARGEVIDEVALIEALETRTIAGAALDVFASEPDIDPRFLRLDNVVLSPHSASITAETRTAIISRLIGDIDAFLDGRAIFDAAADFH